MRLHYFGIILLSACSSGREHGNKATDEKFRPVNAHNPSGHRLIGTWTDGSSENATFQIRTDSIYYVDALKSFPYSIQNDSLKIWYDDFTFSGAYSFSGDTLLLTSDGEISKMWPFAHGQLSLHGLFQLSDAEKILGEKAHLKDSSTTKNSSASVYQCSFTADAEDKKTRKTGSIYFMVEDYREVASARKVYTSIKIANQDHDGIKTLDDLGDEAYFHSDDQNFLMIMARKGNRVLRMKVNKTTSHTSAEEFNAVARKVVGNL